MLTSKQIDILRNRGFIAEEIRLLNLAKDPSGNPQVIDLSSPEWRGVINEREEWARNMKKSGMTRKQYEHIVKKFISGKAKDEGGIFSFLRAQYGRVSVKKVDYDTARGNRAKNLVKNLYKGFTKKKKKE